MPLTIATGSPVTAATTSTSTSTPPPLPPGVDEPACVRQIQSGDSLSVLVDEIDEEGVSVEALQAENKLGHPDHLNAGDLLDICVGNGRNDITGKRRAPGRPAADSVTGVKAQQARLNELFAAFGTPELLVDGWSGPLTRQQLCAARILVGLPVTLTDMKPGGAEERRLMKATELTIPQGVSARDDRWVLIDKTCQIVIGGERDDVRFVFTASTGERGYETRNQEHAHAFRYDPAADNDGWHDSTEFPSAVDNPLNGNMYRPIYFDNGQAIHGANNVPAEPASKGCVRLRIEDQDALVAWLGLSGMSEPTWNRDHIGLAVTVQGDYQPART